MTVLKTGSASPTASPADGRVRRLSFENSNGWLKRYDSDLGCRRVQAGHIENPPSMAKRTDETPVLITKSGKHWYGSLACERDHTASFERDKLETQRQHFTVMLHESDDGKELEVVAAHWDIDALHQVERSLLGSYSVVRNGHQINCEVVKVHAVLEGVGSWHSARPHMQPGKALVIEMGQRTGEEWLIDEYGEVESGRVVEKLGVLSVLRAIAAEDSVRQALTHGESSATVNLSLLTARLSGPTLGRINQANWTAIKAKYAKEYMRTIRGYLKAEYASQTQAIQNIVLTGGGAAFLSACCPTVSEFFIIPRDPQFASVCGAYQAIYSPTY